MPKKVYGDNAVNCKLKRVGKPKKYLLSLNYLKSIHEPCPERKN